MPTQLRHRHVLMYISMLLSRIRLSHGMHAITSAFHLTGSLKVQLQTVLQCVATVTMVLDRDRVRYVQVAKGP